MENVLHPPPETMDFDARSLSKTWKKWKKGVQLYIDIKEARWSTNLPSALLKTFGYDLLTYALLLSEE